MLFFFPLNYVKALLALKTHVRLSMVMTLIVATFFYIATATSAKPTGLFDSPGNSDSTRMPEHSSECSEDDHYDSRLDAMFLIKPVNPNWNFNSSTWIKANSFPNYRELMLGDLLHTHPLIGMKRNKVYKLLGNSDDLQDGLVKYKLNFYWCGNVPVHYLEFEFSHNHVSHFRIKVVDQAVDPVKISYSHWITKNMKW